MIESQIAASFGIYLPVCLLLLLGYFFLEYLPLIVHLPPSESSSPQLLRRRRHRGDSPQLPKFSISLEEAEAASFLRGMQELTIQGPASLPAIPRYPPPPLLLLPSPSYSSSSPS